uniref:Uncharacterized protein n=1 Tax=Oryza sativa subsp. japonica TaxID=39947 RepID=Q5VMH8_ORYSJ|nr:hypothetical protein [Oryza sativa Japonica Group]
MTNGGGDALQGKRGKRQTTLLRSRTPAARVPSGSRPAMPSPEDGCCFTASISSADPIAAASPRPPPLCLAANVLSSPLCHISIFLSAPHHHHHPSQARHHSPPFEASSPRAPPPCRSRRRLERPPIRVRRRSPPTGSPPLPDSLPAGAAPAAARASSAAASAAQRSGSSASAAGRPLCLRLRHLPPGELRSRLPDSPDAGRSRARRYPGELRLRLSRPPLGELRLSRPPLGELRLSCPPPVTPSAFVSGAVLVRW